MITMIELIELIENQARKLHKSYYAKLLFFNDVITVTYVN